jgi:hypothetical protein
MAKNLGEFLYFLGATFKIQFFARFYPVTMPIASPFRYLNMTHRFKEKDGFIKHPTVSLY